MVVAPVALLACVVISATVAIVGFMRVEPALVFVGVIGLMLSLWAAFEMGS